MKQQGERNQEREKKEKAKSKRQETRDKRRQRRGIYLKLDVDEILNSLNPLSAKTKFRKKREREKKFSAGCVTKQAQAPPFRGREWRIVCRTDPNAPVALRLGNGGCGVADAGVFTWKEATEENHRKIADQTNYGRNERKSMRISCALGIPFSSRGSYSSRLPAPHSGPYTQKQTNKQTHSGKTAKAQKPKNNGHRRRERPDPGLPSNSGPTDYEEQCSVIKSGVTKMELDVVHCRSCTPRPSVWGGVRRQKNGWRSCYCMLANSLAL